MSISLSRAFAVITAGLALFLGVVFGMILGGFGLWTAQLSAGTIFGGLASALVVSWLGAVMLQTRWLAAILFSLPMAIGLVVAASEQQWWRCLVVGACLLVPFFVVGQFRRDRRSAQ